jgi:hypothetical protein
MRRRIWSCLLAMLALPGTVSAQPSRATVYVQGGIALNRQAGDSGTTPETYVTAPGGTTLGWLAGGGVEIAGRASLGVEWSATGTMTATEPSRYFTTFMEERRDRLLVVEGRWRLSLSPSLAIEPMAGLVVTFPTASSRAVYTDPLFPRPEQPAIHHRLDRGVGPAFGADVRVGRRVAVVPAVRVFRSAISGGRYDDTSDAHVEIGSIYPGGYPTWTLRGSVALRVAF